MSTGKAWRAAMIPEGVRDGAWAPGWKVTEKTPQRHAPMPALWGLSARARHYEMAFLLEPRVPSPKPWIAARRRAALTVDT